MMRNCIDKERAEKLFDEIKENISFDKIKENISFDKIKENISFDKIKENISVDDTDKRLNNDEIGVIHENWCPSDVCGLNLDWSKMTDKCKLYWMIYLLIHLKNNWNEYCCDGEVIKLCKKIYAYLSQCLEGSDNLKIILNRWTNDTDNEFYNAISGNSR